MSSSRELWWMRWRPPWDDCGREWLEWVEEEETEFEREWMGRKSSEEGSICMLTAVMGRASKRVQRASAREQKTENKKKKQKKGNECRCPCEEAKCARRRLHADAWPTTIIERMAIRKESARN